MKYKNIEEMISKNKVLERRIEDFIKEIDYAKNQKKENKRSDAKQYWNEVIKNYKNELVFLKDNYQSLNKEINYLCNFPEELLIPFIVKYINVYEDEEFVYHKIMLNNSINYSDSFVQNYMFYNLIFPQSLEKDVNKMENTFFISKMPTIYRSFLNENSDKYIMNYSGYEINLVNVNGINAIFKDFPYLESIGYNLANRRINEPEKSLDDILNDELEYQNSLKNTKTLK